MIKTRRRDRLKGVQMIGLLLLFAGMILLIFFPLGTLFGAALMLVAAPLSHKRAVVWECPDCGYSFREP
jgi:hypothetical protein